MEIQPSVLPPRPSSTLCKDVLAYDVTSGTELIIESTRVMDASTYFARPGPEFRASFATNWQRFYLNQFGGQPIVL